MAWSPKCYLFPPIGSNTHRLSPKDPSEVRGPPPDVRLAGCRAGSPICCAQIDEPTNAKLWGEMEEVEDADDDDDEPEDEEGTPPAPESIHPCGSVV